MCTWFQSDRPERPVSSLQTTNSQQHTWPRQSTAAVNTSGSRVVHRSRPFSYLGLLLSCSIASPSLGPSQSIVIRPPLHGRAAPLGALGWNASPPRETRSRLDRGPPIAWRVRFWPQCLGQWEMCFPEADPASAKRDASLPLVAFCRRFVGSVRTPLLCVGRGQGALMRLFGAVLQHAALGTLEPQNLGSMRPLLGTCGTRSLTREPVQPIPQFQCSITAIHGSSATPSGAAYYVRASSLAWLGQLYFCMSRLPRVGMWDSTPQLPAQLHTRSRTREQPPVVHTTMSPSQLTVAWTRHGAREMGRQDIKEIILLSAFRS